MQTHQEACAAHRWEVPPTYNIAADVCDKHPREKPAMVWESFDGSHRASSSWASCRIWRTEQRMSSPRVASRAVTASRSSCRRRPRRQRSSSESGSWARFCCRCPCSTARRASPPARGLGCDAARHGRRERGTLRSRVGAELLLLEETTLQTAPSEFVSAPTSADDPAQLYYTSGTPGARRGSCMRIATSSPTKNSSTATKCRTARGFTGWANGPGPRESRRCSGRGASGPSSTSTGAKEASTHTGNWTS